MRSGYPTASWQPAKLLKHHRQKTSCCKDRRSKNPKNQATRTLRRTARQAGFTALRLRTAAANDSNTETVSSQPMQASVTDLPYSSDSSGPLSF